MKRIIFAVASLFVFAALAVPAASQAAEHHGVGTVEFGSGGLCDATLTYDGDLPGSGTISDLALPNGCHFYEAPVSIEDSYWDADFDLYGTAELDGGFTIDLGNLGLLVYDYESSPTGWWSSGSPTTFTAEGELTLLSGPYGGVSTLDRISLSIEFVD